MTVAGLLQGVAVVLALEGIAYAIAPQVMRRALAAMAAAQDQVLRTAGLCVAVLGVVVAWLLQAA